jgi:hypothetical protein
MSSTKSYREEGFLEGFWNYLPNLVRILSIVGFFIVLINLGAGLLSKDSSSESGNSFVNNSPLQREYNYNKGKKDSKVTYVVFDDFQCPACKGFNETKDNVFSKYEDRVNIVRKHNPLDQIHVNARTAAKAVEAANSQGKYDEFGDDIFKNQERLNNTLLEEIAGNIGIDKTKWESDRGSRTIEKRVELDQDDLKKMYLDKSSFDKQTKKVGDGAGTPTNIILVDNKFYDWWTGGKSEEEISKVLDNALNGVVRDDIETKK